MAEADWQRLKYVVESYPIQTIRVLELAPGRFRLDTDSRGYEGRVVSPESAALRMHVTDQLAERAFRRTQRFLLNLHHDRTVPVNDNQVFYLTDAGFGAPMQVTPLDVRLAVENLAQLHRNLEQVFTETAETAPAPRKRYGTWLRSLEQGRQWMATERVLTKSRTDADAVLLQQWLPRWEEQAGRAMDAFRACGYQELAQRAGNHGEVAWCGYRLDALLRLPSQQIFTLQLSDPVADNRFYDLATLCHEICLAGQGEGVEEAIREYAGQHPLSSAEQAAVRAYAAYPHHGLQVLRMLRMAGARQHGVQDWVAPAERHLEATRKILDHVL